MKLEINNNCTCPNGSSTDGVCSTMSEAGAGLGIFVQYMGGNKRLAHKERNFFEQTPEFRLKSSDRQDRSVNTFLLNENARETNKGFLTTNVGRIIYSPNSNNN